MNFNITIQMADGTTFVARPTLRDLITAEDQVSTSPQNRPITYTARIAYSWARRNGKTSDPFETWCSKVTGIQSDGDAGKAVSAVGNPTA